MGRQIVTGDNCILSIRNISSEIALFINDFFTENQELYNKAKKILEKFVGGKYDIVRTNTVTLLSKLDHNIADDIEDYESYIDGDFSYATIINREICGVDFTRATFCGAFLRNVTFIDCNFYQTNLQKAKLENVDFSFQYLEMADMSYSIVSNCNFTNCCMVDAKLSRAQLKNNDFNDCDMSGVLAYETRYINNYNYKTAIGIPYDMH